jgi:hypothetical protein
VSILRKPGTDKTFPLIAIYGPAGMGKTSLALQAPNPIVFDLDDGVSELASDFKAASIPKTFFSSWDHLIALTEAAIKSKKTKKAVKIEVGDISEELDFNCYDSIILDTLNRIEELCKIHILQTNEVETLTDGKLGFGKGYDVLAETMRKYFDLLVEGRRYFTIIAPCHSSLKKKKNVDGTDWDIEDLKLNEKVSGLVKEMFSAVFFITRDVTPTKVAGSLNKVIGKDTGGTVLNTVTTASHFAKSRYTLPEQISIPIPKPDKIDANVAGFYGTIIYTNTDNLQSEINRLLAKVEDKNFVQQVMDSISKKVTEVEAAGKSKSSLIPYFYQVFTKVNARVQETA